MGLVGEEFGAGWAEVVFLGKVGFAVGVDHEAGAVIVRAVIEAQESVSEFVQDDFPELGLVLYPEGGDDAVVFIEIGEAEDAPILISVGRCGDILVGEADNGVFGLLQQAILPVEDFACTVAGLGIVHQVWGQLLVGQNSDVGHVKTCDILV